MRTRAEFWINVRHDHEHVVSRLGRTGARNATSTAIILLLANTFVTVTASPSRKSCLTSMGYVLYNSLPT